jgi:hypothetical protein
MLQELNNIELQETNGGHHGVAYRAGQAVGEFIHGVGDFFEGVYDGLL